jgi:Tol biopolymer transport system component
MILARLVFAAAVLAALAAPGYAATAAAPPCTLDRADGTTIDAQPFLRHAYGARWNALTDRVAFIEPGADGYYGVYTIRPDGAGRMAVPVGQDAKPGRHQGSAYWHPSGRYLLFIRQKSDWHGRKIAGVPDFEALPGFGRHDDLWLTTADGRETWRLTNDPNTRDEGVLIPVFSPDGHKVAWSARQPGGKYVLKVADFATDPEPHLEHIHSFQPRGVSYYETGSFSSDSKTLFYTSDQDTKSFWQSQIYRLDLATGKSTRLTTGKFYNEHPTVVKTPTGDWIVYMSTKGVDRFPFRLMLGTDWYAMRPDGGGAKRLTTMNLNRHDNPENTGAPMVPGTIAPSPGGAFFLGDVQDSLLRQTGMIKTVRFVCH